MIKKVIPGNDSLILLILVLFLTPFISLAQTSYLGGIPKLPSEVPHPNLLFDINNIQDLKSKMNFEPTETWFNQITMLADKTVSSPPLGDAKYGPQKARDCAFVYLLTEDIKYAVAAKNILMSITQSELDKLNSGDDIHVSNSTVMLCFAYDWMGSSDLLTQSDKEYIENNIAYEAQFLRDHVYDVYGVLKYWGYLSNHHIKANCAGALAALTIPTHPNAEDWLFYALEELKIRFTNFNGNTLIFPDGGGYSEGPNYGLFALEQFIPFVLAYKKRTGVDILSNEKGPDIHKFFEWWVRIRRPDGYLPIFNDSWIVNTEFFLYPIARIYENASVFYWDQIMKSKPQRAPSWWELSTSDRIRPYSYIFYDPSIIPGEPDWNPTQFIDGNSQVIFRKDWTEQSSYMFIIGKKGYSGPHQNPDQTSFEIYAHKAYLIHNPGYGSGTNYGDKGLRDNWRHNIILADDEGPYESSGHWDNGTDKGFLENYFATGFIDGASIRINYSHNVPDVTITRSVFYPKEMGLNSENEYFIIVDNIEAELYHNYDWILHGGQEANDISGIGNTDRTWTVTNEEGINVSIRVHIACPEVTISESTADHIHYYGQIQSHSYIKARSNAQDTQYLVVLYPRKTTMSDPVITNISGENARGAKLIVTEIDQTLEDIVFTQRTNISDVIEDIKSDAKIGFRRKVNDDLKYFVLRNGTYFQCNGKDLLSSNNHLISAALKYNDSMSVLEGNVICSDTSQVTFYLKEGNQSKTMELNVGENKLNINYSEISKSNIDTLPPNNPINLNGHGQTENSIFLSWTVPVPASDGDTVSYYKIFRNDSLIGTSIRNEFMDSGLLESTWYDYAVYSFDEANNKSISAASGKFQTLSNPVNNQLVANISSGQVSISGEKKIPLVLTTSEFVAQVPGPAILKESDQSETVISFNGQTPGDTFYGNLYITSSLAEGPAFFRLPEGSLVDLEGKINNVITHGDSIYIDKTPPQKPRIIEITKF